jgi:hypothetical protein
MVVWRINNMKKHAKKLIILMSCVLFIGITLIVLSQTTSVFAQKNYIPSVTNIGIQSTSSSYIENAYEINQNGERYGSAKYIDIGLLDLVLAEGTNGELGYVKAIDLDEPMPKSPEEAANWKTSDRTINLYASDGTTIIGEFVIKGNENNNAVIIQK